ncbi:MAG: hypothetical protein GVY36_08205 [Verrucomicrobia bacterium]|nr:hypothetical protein [Verrucomicrobiota bacterium]
MKETEMAILGQNAGFSWPFKGSGETPEKYIQYDFEELQSVPGLIGKKSRIRRLFDILRETLAFDDPFSELANSLEAEGETDFTFERILSKYNIPLDFPVHLLHFSPEVEALIKREQIRTLVELVHHGQNSAPDDAEAQDLKDFLNGLAHKDEIGIARHIPFRPNVWGLHLIEAIGLIAEKLPENAQVHLLSLTDARLMPQEEAVLENVDIESAEASLATATDRVAAAQDWFKEESEELEEVRQKEGALDRLFIAINHPERERLGLALAKLTLGCVDDKKSGLFGRLFGR